MKTSLFPCLRLSAIAFLNFFLLSLAWGQTTTFGTIEGRVTNDVTNRALENSRVVIEGSLLEIFTDATGHYRFVNVPAGEVKVSVLYTGYRIETKTVNVMAGQSTQQDYRMVLEGAAASGGSTQVLHLEKYTVTSEKLSNEAAALNEQRVADNIKNVVVFEEFGNMGEGNPGEFLKYVPGVYVNYSGPIAIDVSIRGFPSEGTLFTIDGNPLATTTGTRAFELTGVGTGNIDRLEVTKSPTPDMAANAVGGGVNIRTKSAFMVKEPSLSYSGYFNFNILSPDSPDDAPRFSKQVGVRSGSTNAAIQPGFDLTYLHPVNDKLGFTVSLSSAKRYYMLDFDQLFWDLNRDVLTRYIKFYSVQFYDKQLGSVSLDWKIGKRGALRLSTQYASDDLTNAENRMDFSFATSGTATGTPTTIQSATNGGRVTPVSNGSNFYKNTSQSSLRYTYDGDVWQAELNAGYSRARRHRDDQEDGFFGTQAAFHGPLTMQADGIQGLYNGESNALPVLVARNNTGATVNVYDAGAAPITTATSFGLHVDNQISSADFSLKRDFDPGFPLTVRVGAAIKQDEVVQDSASTRIYTFAPPGSTAASRTGNNYGLVAEEFSDRVNWYDVTGARVPVRFLSSEKLFALFKEHPEYFTLNEANEFVSAANTAKAITETINAAFIRFDAKLLSNRLRVTTGVRYEETKDDALGPLNDLSRTYQRDANGNLIRNAAGNPIKLPGTALELAKLQYTRYGRSTQRQYDDFYPSLNASYTLTDNLLLRFAYARTIARPSLAQITPGVTLPDVTTSASRIITVVNEGLTAATSNSYDLTLEYYGKKGTVASAGVFFKEMKNFISRVSIPLTPDLVDLYGIPEDYATGYTLSTAQNFGGANVSGAEASVRQALNFLPGWARGLSVFANATVLERSGTNAEDLNQFAEYNFNYGVSLARPRFLVKLNVAMTGEIQQSRVATSALIPEDTFDYSPPRTMVDLSAEYRIVKQASLFLSVRNLLQANNVYNRATATTPDFSERLVVQRTGALISVGVKGSF
ncbi:TonB-dependent receptor [Oleiharenicola lentus]|uniref:TonB-dependent receptor n=1 Tax=Oleiharenicola lentus TaxID=2508720 RepID=UPI003F66B72B